MIMITAQSSCCYSSYGGRLCSFIRWSVVSCVYFANRHLATGRHVEQRVTIGVMPVSTATTMVATGIVLNAVNRTTARDADQTRPSGHGEIT